MGAFDSYTADVPCPDCGDIHQIRGQTKIFDPDYDDQRWFEIGAAMPATFTAADVPELAGSDWIRIRPASDDDEVTQLVDFDELFECGCGRRCAVLLCFALAPGTVMLTGIELLDARTEIAERCDYVESRGLWTGDFEEDRVAIVGFGTRSFAERAAWLRARLNECFRDEADDNPNRSPILVGPTQCEACGDVRERRLSLWWNHSFFNTPWRGPLFLGAKIPFDDAWLADDIDRPSFLRARHPVGESTLKIVGRGLRFGCRCGAGMARAVACFARRPGELELVEITLRAVNRVDDLHDIDFVESQTRIERSDLTRELLLSRALS